MELKIPFLALILIGFFQISSFAGAFEKPLSRDPSPAVAIEILQNWRTDTAERSDLDDRERDLRQQFISRLLFQTEQKYRGIDLRQFLQTSISDMNVIDQMSRNQSWGSMEIFLENLNQSLNDLIEPHESALLFIQSFTEFSGISDPALMEEFAETRSYFDGRQMLAAHPMNREQAADLAEEMEALEPLPPLDQESELHLNENLIE